MTNFSKYYEPNAFMNDPVCSVILVSLLGESFIIYGL